MRIHQIMKLISKWKCDHLLFCRSQRIYGFGLQLLLFIGLILTPSLNLKLAVEFDSIETSAPAEECPDGYEKVALSEISIRSPKQRLQSSGRFVALHSYVACIRQVIPQPLASFDGHRLSNGDCAPQRT